MLEALVFDVDGTLAETEEFHRLAFNRAFRELGIPMLWGQREYRRLLLVTGGRERILHSAGMRGLALEPERALQAHAAKTRFYAEHLRASAIAWRPGVRRLLAEAAERNVKVGIATTTSTGALAALLASSLGPGWRDAFGAVVTGEEVERKKPAPDVYLEALRRLGVRARSAIAFEDSRAGVRAARAAGMLVVGTPSEWLAGDDLSEADLVIESLGDPEAPWPQENPSVGRRWLGLDDLIAWHRAR